MQKTSWVTNEEFEKRQADASALIAATENSVDRELLTFAYNAVIGRLVHSHAPGRALVFEPVEVLETFQYMLRHKEVLAGLIAGRYSTFEEACEDLGVF